MCRRTPRELATKSSSCGGPSRPGAKRVGVGRLVQGLHGDRHLVPHPGGERIRGHEDEVVALVELGRGHVGMADVPQDVDLARRAGGFADPEQVDRHVVARRPGLPPLVAELDPRRPAQPAKRPLQVPREVEIAPRGGHVPGRGGAPDGHPARTDPGGQRVADRGGCQWVRGDRDRDPGGGRDTRRGRRVRRHDEVEVREPGCGQPGIRVGRLDDPDADQPARVGAEVVGGVGHEQHVERGLRRADGGGGGGLANGRRVGADDPSVGDLADHPPERSQRLGPLPGRRARRRGHDPHLQRRPPERAAGDRVEQGRPVQAARPRPHEALAVRRRALPAGGPVVEHARRRLVVPEDGSSVVDQAPARGPEAKGQVDILLAVEIARVEPADGLEHIPPHQQARRRERGDLAHRCGHRAVGIVAGPDRARLRRPVDGSEPDAAVLEREVRESAPRPGARLAERVDEPRAHRRHIGRLDRLDKVAEPVRPDGLHVVVEEEDQVPATRPDGGVVGVRV